MAVLPSGLSPEFLSDGASDILDRQDKPKLELVKNTVTEDLTPPKVAPVAPPAKETTTTDPVAAARERAQRKFDREQELKKLEEEEKKAKGAASKAEYAKVLAQYEPQLNAPAPKFESPKESFTQIAGLGMMMMMLGSMAGGKTYGSAIGAMNGIAGMMKGYQEGRKEAYDRAKVEFEENLKQWKENKTQVKEAFTRALKLGSKDISKATAEVVSELTAKGETTVADLVKKNGLPNVAQAFNQASDNADRHLDAVQSAVARTSAPVGERRVLAGAPPTPDTPEKPKTRAERMKQLKDELLAIEREETGLTAEQEARKALGKPETPAVSKSGQMIGDILESQTPEAAKAATNRINQYTIDAADKKIIKAEWDATTLANDVATYVAEHPEAIGFLAQTVGKVGEPGLGILQNINQMFSSDPANYETNSRAALEQKSQQTDRLIDEAVKEDPSKESVARAAKVVAKKLFSLALADAVAVGRPTVFLERSLSNFYSPNVRPKTLIEIIQTRANDANERLPSVFRNNTRKEPTALLTSKSPEDFLRMIGSKAPAAASSALPTPKTEEEFNALKKGDRYIDPDDGKVYIK